MKYSYFCFYNNVINLIQPIDIFINFSFLFIKYGEGVASFRGFGEIVKVLPCFVKPYFFT